MNKLRFHKFFQLVLGLVIVLAQSNPSALVIRPTEVTCPLDGERFQADQIASYTSAGQFLDMKPFGATAASPPVAKCPASGFPVYKDSFSDAEIHALKAFVSSENWRLLKERNTDYYVIAKIREHLGETSAQVRYVLLRATWEAKTKLQYKQYAQEALVAYNAALTQEYNDIQQWLTDQLVAGELERRLRKFDKAKARFINLSSHEDMQNGVFQGMLSLQLKLISARDSEPRKIP